MGKAALTFLVLLDLTTTEHNVSVPIKEIVVNLGNILMDTNVFISKIHAQKVQGGMETLVNPREIALQDFIAKDKLVSHSLKDVFLQLFGKIIDAYLAETNALQEHTEQILLVFQ